MVKNGFICYFIFILLLECSCQFQYLNSIADLKKIDFGNSFPRHGLLLLHWFANNIDIDINNNDIIPRNFEPNRGDYGIHYYGNHERLLNVLLPVVSGRSYLSVNYNYYVLGNLTPNNNHNNALALPSYITRRFYNPGGKPDNNRDRIIVRVRQEYNSLTLLTRRTIDQVYITQHPQRTYDPTHTYLITTNLLREIQGLSQVDMAAITPRRWYHRVVHIYQSILSQLQRWNTLSTVAMNMRWKCDNGDVDILQIHLEVRTVGEGKARIYWRGVPGTYLNCATVALFKNNDDHVQLSIFSIVDRSSGGYDTLVPLHPGLQVRLHKVDCGDRHCQEEILRGPEFHDANGVVPVYLKDQDGASLQLFVREGKACVRLYVRNTFDNWRSEFQGAWVGIYPSEVAQTAIQTQMLRSFDPEARTDSADIPDYQVYVFHSTVPMSPGLQARILYHSPVPLASTPPWNEYVLQPPPVTGASPWVPVDYDEL